MPVNGLKYVTIEEKEVPMKENTITGSARRSGKKRIRWIDLARAFGILTVVLCHCVHEIYRLQLTYMSSLHRSGRLFGFAAFTAGRLGVPLFLMISGYLLLNRAYTADRCRYFFRHNFLRLLACTEIWFLFYHIFLSVTNLQDFSLRDMLLEMLFIKNGSIGHMWYMPVILGVYLLLPAAANALHSLELSSLRIPYIIVMAYAFASPVLVVLAQTAGWPPLSRKFELGFSGGIYGLYLVTGWLIRRGLLKKTETPVLCFTALCGFVLTVGLQYYAYRNLVEYNVWYDCGLLMICAVCLFELFSRIRRVPLYTGIRFLSGHAFGIYLIHYLFILILAPVIRPLSVMLPVRVFLLWLAVLLLSCLLSLLISRIPRCGRFLLYMK